MINALAVIASITVLLGGLAFTRIRFKLSYDGSLTASVKLWFMRFRLFPKKEEKISPSKYKIKRFRKRIKRELRRTEKKRLNKLRKKEKKQIKKERRENEIRKKNGGELPPKKKKSPKELIELITKLLKVFFTKFPRYLRTDTARLIIGVASDDAAKTAVTYGLTVQAVQYLIWYMREKTDFRVNEKAVVSVYPDFLSENWTADIELTFSIRVWQVLAVGAELALAYLGLGKYKESKKQSKIKNTEQLPIQ